MRRRTPGALDDRLNRLPGDGRRVRQPSIRHAIQTTSRIVTGPSRRSNADMVSRAARLRRPLRDTGELSEPYDDGFPAGTVRGTLGGRPGLEIPGGEGRVKVIIGRNIADVVAGGVGRLLSGRTPRRARLSLASRRLAALVVALVACGMLVTPALGADGRLATGEPPADTRLLGSQTPSIVVQQQPRDASERRARRGVRPDRRRSMPPATTSAMLRPMITFTRPSPPGISSPGRPPRVPRTVPAEKPSS